MIALMCLSTKLMIYTIDSRFHNPWPPLSYGSLNASFDSINWTLKSKSLLRLFPAWYYSTWRLLHCSESNIWNLTAQNIKFSIKDISSIFDQIQSFLRNWKTSFFVQ